MQHVPNVHLVVGTLQEGPELALYTLHVVRYTTMEPIEATTKAKTGGKRSSRTSTQRLKYLYLTQPQAGVLGSSHVVSNQAVQPRAGPSSADLIYGSLQ